MTFQRMDDSFATFRTAVDIKQNLLKVTRNDDKKWKGQLAVTRQGANRMTLDGQMGQNRIGMQLSLTDRKKFLLVNRGFHWIQDYPFKLSAETKTTRGKIEQTMPKVTIQIDPSACILAANCVGMEPKFFQIGQESYAELTDPNGASHGTEHTFEVTDAELEMIEEAVDSCPTRAISMQSGS